MSTGALSELPGTALERRTTPPTEVDGVAGIACLISGYARRTPSAWGPFAPVPTSKTTAWPSSKDL